MDSLTQIVLGAAVGEAVLGPKVGRKAAIWGAIGGTIPDLDVLVNFWMDDLHANHFHRTWTHSLLFHVVSAPVFGYGLSRLYKGQGSFRDWTLLMFLALFTHSLLDCCTTWGTYLFYPFSTTGIAWKNVFVIDPTYTLPLAVFVIAAMRQPRSAPKRKKLIKRGLMLSTGYLILGFLFNRYAHSVFTQEVGLQYERPLRADMRPTPFNILLWGGTAEMNHSYITGYYALPDGNYPIRLTEHPKQHELLEPYLPDERVQMLLDMSAGWYTIERVPEGLRFNDLRFGKSGNIYKDEVGRFVFSYTLHIDGSGDLTKVTQNDRDIGEGTELMRSLFRRILDPIPPM